MKWFGRTDGKESIRVAILGCQRSGTTLLREVLHSGEIFTFEENWIPSYFARERWHAVGAWHASSNNSSVRQIAWDKAVKDFYGNTYGQVFLKEREARHKFWGIKAPGLNMAMAAPYIKDVFRNTKFVVIARDPRDTYSSMKRSPNMTNYLPDDFYSSPVNSPDLVEIFMQPYKYWARVYEALDKLRVLFPGDVYTVKYEDLIENPEVSVKNMCEFLGMKFSDSLFEPFTRNISNASVVSMSVEDYARGQFVTKNRAIGRWRDVLTQEEAKSITEACMAVAEGYGYSPD